MAKKQTGKIPKSKAKNAYALLNEVKALILEEPKRYNQSIFIARAPDDISDCDAPEGIPACGTVGCVAGWVATLKRPSGRFGYDQASGIAGRILGLSAIQQSNLFDGGAVNGSTGTMAYAKNGAKHITEFQKQHARQLKAKRV